MKTTVSQPLPKVRSLKEIFTSPEWIERERKQDAEMQLIWSEMYSSYLKYLEGKKKENENV